MTADTRMATLLTAFVCGLLLSACGTRKATHGDAAAIASAAWQGIRSGSLADAKPHFTKAGWNALQRDLAAWTQSLTRDDAAGAALRRALARRFKGDADHIRAEAQRVSDDERVRLLVGMHGWPNTSPVAEDGAARPKQEDTARFLYNDGLGVARPIDLVRTDDGWRIARFQLGS